MQDRGAVGFKGDSSCRNVHLRLHFVESDGTDRLTERLFGHVYLSNTFPVLLHYLGPPALS